MKKRAVLAALCAVAMTSAARASEAPNEIEGGWKLVWNDEFDGETLDASKWTAENAALEKNHEAQYYTPENVVVHGGVLKLVSQRRRIGPRPFASGLVETKDKFARAYGRFEIRAKLPKGQGVWPAHWLMPNDDSWPPEIDIMELLGHDPNRIHMTNHYTDERGVHRHHGDSFRGPDFSKGFHVFAVEWERDEIRWYVDGRLRFSTRENVPDVPMRIILNTAVGGDWPGYPTKKTEFPQEHVIDYVRVYARAPRNITFVEPES